MGEGLGFGMPSSVFRDPKDGMYSVMLLTNWGQGILAQKGGQCLVRTSDITDPASWRAYGGAAKGFSVRVNASPLLEQVTDPVAHTCQVLRHATGEALKLRHISLLWSTFYNQYLAFGEANSDPESTDWGFSLSSDLLTWSEPALVLNPRWNTTGNATITALSPMPGRWIVSAHGGSRTAPFWVQSDGGFKYKTSCGPCPAICEVCPGMGDVCSQAENVSSGVLDRIPTASMDFSCGLVSKLDGYSGYIYPTLIDDSYHAATGADPSLNIVQQTANVFFVANPCAGTQPWKPGGGTAKANELKCTILDSKQRTRRNIVRSTVRFDLKTGDVVLTGW